jgi:hypothetical protein
MYHYCETLHLELRTSAGKNKDTEKRKVMRARRAGNVYGIWRRGNDFNMSIKHLTGRTEHGTCRETQIMYDWIILSHFQQESGTFSNFASPLRASLELPRSYGFVRKVICPELVGLKMPMLSPITHLQAAGLKPSTRESEICEAQRSLAANRHTQLVPWNIRRGIAVTRLERTAVTMLRVLRQDTVLFHGASAGSVHRKPSKEIASLLFVRANGSLSLRGFRDVRVDSDFPARPSSGDRT